MQKLLVYVDIFTKALIDASGNFINKINQFPTIERGQWQVLCIQFMERKEDEYGYVSVTPHSLSQNSSYIFVADSDFDDDGALMMKSLQSATPFDASNPQSNRINIQGDWIDGGVASLKEGQLSVRINADTVKFTEVIGKEASIDTGLYACVKQYSEGLSNPSSIAWFQFVARNTIRDWSNQEENPPEGALVEPFISDALKNPLEFEFAESADGEWHSEQLDTDKYYRQRIANIDATWSSAIAFVLTQGAGGGSTNAADIIVSAESQYYAGMDVAAALQAIGAELDGLEESLSSIATDMEAI